MFPRIARLDPLMRIVEEDSSAEPRVATVPADARLAPAPETKGPPSPPDAPAPRPRQRHPTRVS